MYESNEENKECQMKYFFACIEYTIPHYIYMGVKPSYGYIDKYDIIKQSGTFSLDHYPNKYEIIDNIVSHCDIKNPEIISYNELTKEAYDAY
jgi:hypothetical protein